MRREDLSYQDLVRRILAGPLLSSDERRRAESILDLDDTLEIARRLATLLERLADRGALKREARREGDADDVRRFVEPGTNDHWTVEIPGVSRAGPGESGEPVASATPPEAPGEAPAAARGADRPRLVQPVEEVRCEPGVARRFVDERTGEPLRTLFGAFASRRTPEELGAALTPLREQLVARTSASDVRFHLVETKGKLTPIPLRDVVEALFAPRSGRIAARVLEDRSMLHVPNTAARDAGLGDARPGALVAVPLVSGERVQGLMEVLRDVPGPFEEDELSLFRLAALSAAGIVAGAEILERLIFLDRLTGLYNRAYFDDQIEREIERANRNGTSMALVMADLDHFKRINDTFGHQAGDRALAHVGAIMRSNIRAMDLAARYGGEEFALLLPGTTRERTAQTAERLRRVMADTKLGDVIPELREVHLTISLGFALYPDDAATAKQLIDRADRVALYAAKNGGRNRVVGWSAETPEQSTGVS